MGGLVLRLLEDTASLSSESDSTSTQLEFHFKPQLGLYMYLAAVPLFTLQFQLNMWEAFLATDPSFVIVKTVVSALSAVVGL